MFKVTAVFATHAVGLVGVTLPMVAVGATWHGVCVTTISRKHPVSLTALSLAEFM